MRLTFAVLLLILALIAPVRVEAGNPLSREVARKHYQLGEMLYKTSNHKGALVEFKKAYELEPLPALLFNIARCYEVMADVAQAIKIYRLYLKKQPDSPKRSLVEARLKNLEERKKAIAAAKAKPPVAKRPAKPVTKPPPARPAPSPVRPAPSGGWKRTAGWVALGTGVASLGAGVAFTVLALDKADEFNASKKSKTYVELLEIEDTGTAYGTAQIVTLVVGGVAAAAGAGLLLWHYLGKSGDKAARTSVSVSPFFSEHGFGLCGGARF